MSRYLPAMTRDEMVAEIRDLILLGVVDLHEVTDPTILPPHILRANLLRLRLRAVEVGADGWIN